MYFITKTTSTTGKKFAAIEAKATKGFKEAVKLAKKYGFKKWRQDGFAALGGISCALFETEPDKKVWKKQNDGWAPRMRGPGSKIYSEFKDLTMVSRTELNQCIGFDSVFQTIGFTRRTGNGYYGFSVGEDWKVKIPKDCREVTATKYHTLFKIKK